jgi:hypothetical protein
VRVSTFGILEDVSEQTLVSTVRARGADCEWTSRDGLRWMRMGRIAHAITFRRGSLIVGPPALRGEAQDTRGARSFPRTLLPTSVIRLPLRHTRVAYIMSGMRQNPPPVVRGSRSDKILRWLARRPGQEFRAVEIARGIKHPTQATANECGRLARRGLIVRKNSEDRTVRTLYTSVAPPK